MKRKKQYRSCLSMAQARRFSGRDVHRITGKIARTLAINSPWIDVLAKEIRNMKKYKKIIILKNVDTLDSQAILFEKPMKIGQHSIRVNDIFGLSCRGSYKITVQFKPSTRKGKC